MLIKRHNKNFENNNIILNLEDFTGKCINYLEKEENLIKDVCLEFKKIYEKNKENYEF